MSVLSSLLCAPAVPLTAYLCDSSNPAMLIPTIIDVKNRNLGNLSFSVILSRQVLSLDTRNSSVKDGKT